MTQVTKLLTFEEFLELRPSYGRYELINAFPYSCFVTFDS